MVYLSILDIHADTLEAMSEVAAMLHKEYLQNTTARHLVVVGDAKTYLRLKELKQHYGSELEWLIPFIGDWHVLHNYQETLMNVYYDAGLKELAMASGFRAATRTSLAKASNFKHMHAFVMQVWEAFHRHFFTSTRPIASLAPIVSIATRLGELLWFGVSMGLSPLVWFGVTSMGISPLLLGTPCPYATLRSHVPLSTFDLVRYVSF